MAPLRDPVNPGRDFILHGSEAIDTVRNIIQLPANPITPTYRQHGTTTGRYSSDTGFEALNIDHDKETDMELSAQYERLANQRMEEAARAQAMADREREIEARFGKDDWPDDTVLSFNHQYNGVGIRYNYVAYKIKGTWYVAGRDGAKWSWDALVNFMKDTEYLYWADSWKQVF